MKVSEIPGLVDQFENDILYDCHSLSTRVSRSEAGKEISKLNPMELNLIRRYVKNHKVDTSYEGLRKEVEVAWEIVLKG